MLFNSLQYLAFLGVVVVAYWLLPRRARLGLLLACSLFFYGSWDWRFLFLLGFTTGVDYVVARCLDGTDDRVSRRRLVLVSLCSNLGVLAYFKYAGFFTEQMADLLTRLGVPFNMPVLEVLLPVGISFFTFQSIAYVIDVYRREIPACRDLVLYGTFVAFFPQLVAGPISRARSLIPQLAADRRPPSRKEIVSGLALIVRGLVRKVVLADPMSAIVAAGFAKPGSAGWVTVAAAVVAFAIQIYGDFAGYTDIARGSSRLFGVELIHNFRQPYLSRSITEFWRRWHISLSNWLRDYLYIPLGGNRRGPRRTAINLGLTMVLGGLWHGAAWTFLIWGALHGLYLAAERRWRPNLEVTDDLPTTPRRLFQTLTTFALVCVAWVFFRASSASNAFEVLRALVTPTWVRPDPDHLALLAFAVVTTIAIDVLERRGDRTLSVARRRPAMAGATLGLALGAIVVFSGQSAVPFLYFQF